MSQPPETGVIHDIGFRHYDGPRLGRGYLLRMGTADDEPEELRVTEWSV